jgi:cell wall-associated NlpC family hydrolase
MALPARPAPWALVRRTRAALALVLTLAVLTSLGPGAAADDVEVFPSQAEVDASRAAAAGRAGRVGAIEAQLAAAGVRADRLTLDVARAVEAFNGARVRLDRAEAAVAEAEREARAARVRVAASRTELGRFAAAAYRSGGDLGGLSAFLVADSPRDLISRAAALQSIGNSRRHALESLRAAQAHAAVLEQRAADMLAKRRAAARDVARAKAGAEARLATQRAQMQQVVAQRDRLVRRLADARNTTVALERARQAGLERERAEAARREAERRAAEAARRAEEQRRAEEARRAEDARRAAAEQARRAEEQRQAEEARRAEEQRQAQEQRRAEESRPTPSPEGRDEDVAAPAPPSPAPAPSPSPAPSAPPDGSSQGTASGAQAAVAYARAQIGKPYQWAADGPSSFDCSGLTMRAWEQGGVALPHHSVSQYRQAQKVPVTGLQPGDLVFFASGSDYRSIYHVGLFIGNGQMIEAPYTGEDVRIASIWRSSLFGAARP